MKNSIKILTLALGLSLTSASFACPLGAICVVNNYSQDVFTFVLKVSYPGGGALIGFGGNSGIPAPFFVKNAFVISLAMNNYTRGTVPIRYVTSAFIRGCVGGDGQLNFIPDSSKYGYTVTIDRNPFDVSNAMQITCTRNQ